MKLAHEKDIFCERREGEVGHVHICDLMDTPSFLLGVRYIGPNSTVPKRPHRHELAQANYIIEGTGTVTNDKEAFSFGPGDILLMDGDEEHYFTTTGGIKMNEIRYR